MLDLAVSLVFLSLFPILLFIVDKPLGLIKNCITILFSKKSWVGYYFPREEDKQKWNLPKIKEAVLNPLDALNKQLLDTPTIQKLNMLYAKDYRLWNDLNIVWKGFRDLGRTINS